ncbi:hypothetical protein [Stenotrophomonas phage BUCTxx99]|nr:hypothetical protein [Stenotrophomonas phage BUCTxx99]
MKLHTNMLSGVDDNVVIMHMLAKPHVSRTHTWINLNGDHKVLIVQVDMTETGEKNFLLEIWRIKNVEDPNVGFQHFDRHVAADKLVYEPINGWLYPDRSALMTDLFHFIDANVHNA